MNVLLVLTFLTIWANSIRADFHQNDYHVNHEKIVITKYNHTHLRNPHIELIKHEGVRMLAINGSGEFLHWAKKNIPIEVLVFKFAKEKFRPFPINVTLDACHEVNTNVFGAQSAIAASNYRGCPAPPGEYHIKDYLLEEDLFPPHLPLGRYKLIVQINIDDVIFLAEGIWEGNISARKHST